jgi:hypothetical protein
MHRSGTGGAKRIGDAVTFCCLIHYQKKIKKETKGRSNIPISAVRLGEYFLMGYRHHP